MGSAASPPLFVVGMFRPNRNGATVPGVSPRMGRPKSEDPRVHVVSVRLSQAEMDLIMKAASRFDLPLGTWTRERLVAAARRALR
jgi:hypothetical protein